MHDRIRRIGTAGCWILALCWIGGCAEGEPPPAAEETPQTSDEGNVADSTFSIHHDAIPSYTAGDTVSVAVTLDYAGEEPVTAMALEVTPPPGWHYAGIVGALRPAVEPPAGSGGTLTFVWIQIPEFPATLEYALDVPADASGALPLSTQVIYRALAGEMQSPVETVELQPAP